MSLPTVPQMKNRATDGHRKALAAIAEGRPAVRPGAYASEVRGMRTVLATLARWECTTADGLTDRGRDLLAALNERIPR